MNQTFDTSISNELYDYYHITYPDNCRALEIFIKSLPVQNKHTNAMLHFISCLESNESGMIYGMLCNAWQKYIEENFKVSVG